jgi:hypothetical protein
VRKAEPVKITPAVMMATGGALLPEEFMKALKAHPEAKAFVLFFGFPDAMEKEFREAAPAAKFIVVSAYRRGYKRLLTDKLIDLALVPKLESPSTPETKPVANVQEQFDREYVVLKPEQAASLP